MIKTERKQINRSQTECCLPPPLPCSLIPSYMYDVYMYMMHIYICTHTQLTPVLGDPSVLFGDGLFVAMLIRSLMSEDSNALLGVTIPSSSLNPAPLHSLHCLRKWTLCTHPCRLPHPTSLSLSPRWRAGSPDAQGRAVAQQGQEHEARAKLSPHRQGKPFRGPPEIQTQEFQL